MVVDSRTKSGMLNPIGMPRGSRTASVPTPSGWLVRVPHAGKSTDRAALTTVIVLAALLLIFLAIPVVALIVRALGSGAEWDARTLQTLRQALSLSLVTTAISMFVVILLGTPLAFLLARRRFPGAAVVEALVDLPIVLPPAVAGIALLMAFGRRGVIGQWLDQLTIAHSWVNIPALTRGAPSLHSVYESNACSQEG